MAEALKHHLSPALVRRVGAQIGAVWPEFDGPTFERLALQDFEGLGLTDRARAVQRAMAATLPGAFPDAARILVASLGAELTHTDEFGMEVFAYLAHVYFAAEQGLEHFEPAMALQYELTKRFTAEFSLRAFVERYPEATMERLAVWVRDPNPHVRRLVSEGTRPRLPWAPRLARFVRDPRPMLPLLELLRDDPELYVRRSVANHLNDIGKDHPELLLDLCERWISDPTPARRWVVRHATRSLIKAGHPRAIALEGGHGGELVASGTVMPDRAAVGAAVDVCVRVHNASAEPARAVVDVAVHFVRTRDRHAIKVFKGGVFTLGPGEARTLNLRVSLAPMSTRALYPGLHRVDARVNGVATPVGAFWLDAAAH